MKRILLSLMTISLVAAVGVAATRAFFSDVERSEGNIFTAGKVNLKIDYNGYYNQAPGETPDITWELKNLVNEKFFNFNDVKPGDYGEGTISLHVLDNDAYACLIINNMQNLENDRIDPEVEAGDTTDGTGELAQNLYFTAWADNGNNIWEADEPLLFTNNYGPASDVLDGRIYALADPSTGGPISKGSTMYIGLQWCAGTMMVNTGDNTISCNGAGMGSDTQTDSVTADLIFYVEQARNNDSFSCDTVVIPMPTP